MTKAINTQVKKIERPISLWIALAILVMLASVYIYLISVTVKETMVLEDMGREKEALSSQVVDGESVYNLALSKIDQTFANSFGFREAMSNETHFVNLSSGVAILPSNDI